MGLAVPLNGKFLAVFSDVKFLLIDLGENGNLPENGDLDLTDLTPM